MVGSWHHHQLKGKVEIVGNCLRIGFEEHNAGVERSTHCVVRNAVALLGFWSAHGVRRWQGCVARS
ncbi:hypothetical protein A2U01_0072011 [Trifolium medium]|uniref:Uncharacterized protein n=1 Tax=Trifolium medium TaxID=97028 RepID=A0A392SQT8_9FABA|nr:hypothetical protein [Trifolium medium]